MRLVNDDNTASTPEPIMPTEPFPQRGAADGWPREVELILSAMEAGQNAEVVNRRRSPRRSHRTQAELSLFAHGPLTPPIVLYTRDISAEGIGFITRERVTLGYNGMVKLSGPDGQPMTVQCTVYRCRESINGWYEGSLTFAVEQPRIA